MRNLFKKVGSILIVGMMMFLLVGCGSKEEDVTTKVNYNLSKMTQTTGIDQGTDKINRIKARDEYKEIISLGNEALDVMLNRFSESSEDKLREYIMAVACSEILGEASMDKETGRTWYDDYMKNK